MENLFSCRLVLVSGVTFEASTALLLSRALSNWSIFYADDKLIVKMRSSNLIYRTNSGLEIAHDALMLELMKLKNCFFPKI